MTVCGTWSPGPKYGRQFNAQTWEESLPASVYGLEKYLGSGLIKGIGPKFAKLIVRKFGADSIDIIENEPERLIEVENISPVTPLKVISSSISLGISASPRFVKRGRSRKKSKMS